MSNTFKGFAAGIIAAIFYGTNPLGTLFLYQDEINPTSVLVWRYAIASLLFLAWMMAKRESFHLRLGPAIRMAVLGTFMAMSSATLTSVSSTWMRESPVRFSSATPSSRPC